MELRSDNEVGNDEPLTVAARRLGARQGQRVDSAFASDDVDRSKLEAYNWVGKPTQAVV